jgi:hypothetical protein
MHISAITSSNNRPLGPFLKEITRLCDLTKIDLFMLRRVDLEGVLAFLDSQGFAWPVQGKPKTVLELLGIEDTDVRNAVCRGIAEWFAQQFAAAKLTPEKIQIAAIATYFPQIAFNDRLPGTTSQETRELKKRSIRALASVVKIINANPLKPFVGSPVIEIVCGSVFDAITIPSNQQPPSAKTFLVSSKKESKIKDLLDSLSAVVKLSDKDDRFNFACELEPDDVFVFSDIDSLKRLAEAIEARPDLAKKVSLNMDLAHLALADIKPRELEPYSNLFSHAHLSDHASIHTRDRAPGTWKILENWSSEIYGYFSILERSYAMRSSSGQVCSGAIAIELEGCGRIRWLLESVAMTKYSLAMLDTWRDKIRHHHQLIGPNESAPSVTRDEDQQ